MNKQSNHWYILPDGTIVDNQKDGCAVMGIGRNAFRNRVKNGIIKRITDKPKGYENGKETNKEVH